MPPAAQLTRRSRCSNRWWRAIRRTSTRISIWRRRTLCPRVRAGGRVMPIARWRSGPPAPGRCETKGMILWQAAQPAEARAFSKPRFARDPRNVRPRVWIGLLLIEQRTACATRCDTSRRRSGSIRRSPTRWWASGWRTFSSAIATRRRSPCAAPNRSIRERAAAEPPMRLLRGAGAPRCSW